MTSSSISVTVRQLPGDMSALDIRGQVTAAAEEALMGAYTQASEGGAKVLALNFQGLEYMNSGGIGLIVTLLIRANRQSQRLVAVGLSEHYRHIFQLTRLDEAIPAFDSEEQAAASTR
jgi:anti-sigma B factor antagonist